ncbi:MAG: fumarylacetoacetase [Legionella sp.]|nr:MAG: fumarylacetoacetase [Legionella sp.]
MELKSFITDADDSLFSLYNLPYGIFSCNHNENYRVGVAIGNQVLDLACLEHAGLIKIANKKNIFNQTSLNIFAGLDAQTRLHIRNRIQLLLSINNDELQKNKSLRSNALISTEKITMAHPFQIEGFSDFYTSEHHATNVGKLFRDKDNPLLPNWKYLPVGYNGRVSTINLSGHAIRRPKGQIKHPDQHTPVFSESRKLDFELEMGVFVAQGNPDGTPISVDKARKHIFGLVLLNDWSARDIQAFEYQPLGPFLSKSFATSISPWVVPLEALQDYCTPMPIQQPEPVDYLKQKERSLIDIKLKIQIQPKDSTLITTVCETNFSELYWSMEQMLAHHTINNCIMKTGDLLGTGTISGSDSQSWGSLLEKTYNGTQPIQLDGGETRHFLEDGDSVIITGYCDNGKHKLGFGKVENKIVAAS